MTNGKSLPWERGGKKKRKIKKKKNLNRSSQKETIDPHRHQRGEKFLSTGESIPWSVFSEL